MDDFDVGAVDVVCRVVIWSVRICLGVLRRSRVVLPRLFRRL